MRSQRFLAGQCSRLAFSLSWFTCRIGAGRDRRLKRLLGMRVRTFFVLESLLQVQVFFADRVDLNTGDNLRKELWLISCLFV